MSTPTLHQTLVFWDVGIDFFHDSLFDLCFIRLLSNSYLLHDLGYVLSFSFLFLTPLCCCGYLPVSSREESVDISNKVYVGGIPYYSTKDDIRSYFEGCGTIMEVDCMNFPDSGKFRGIAIITFKVDSLSEFCFLIVFVGVLCTIFR